jgi:hypothetical protein
LIEKLTQRQSQQAIQQLAIGSSECRTTTLSRPAKPNVTTPSIAALPSLTITAVLVARPVTITALTAGLITPNTSTLANSPVAADRDCVARITMCYNELAKPTNQRRKND